LKPNIVVLASGSGSNFQAILNAIEQGTIDAQVVRLIASRAGIGAIEKAKLAGIDTQIISKSAFESSDAFAHALLSALQLLEPRLIVLAGYLVQIPVEVIKAFPNRIVNIHPSLLPEFGGKGYYGIKVHEAVLKSGKTESGCTVHLVSENYDEGPILAQSRIRVEPNDTPESLAQRVLSEEHKLLPRTIQTLLQQTK
jgi:phosphoribosylglycinamide formyltransferase 1